MYSSASAHRYPLAEFFTDMFQTRLGEQELLASIMVPRQPAGSSFGYRRFSYREGEYPLAVAACRLEWNDGICTGARVAVGGGDVSPKRLPDLEDLLTSTPVDAGAQADAAHEVPAMLHPVADVRGSAAWKTTVVADLVARTVADAARRTEAVDG